MYGVFDKYQWDAPIYKTYAEAARALENFQIKEKKKNILMSCYRTTSLTQAIIWWEIYS